MKVARVRVQRFRGFQEAVLSFSTHTVISGEPRAGRTDLVEALRRVLSFGSTRNRVNPLDIHRPLPADGDVPLTEVEVTLLELGPQLERLFDESLESFDARTGELADTGGAATSVLGLRLCYRAHYDFETDTGDHWVDFPGRSAPEYDVFRRVGRAEREALPVLFISNNPPLQLRAEGALRELLTNAGSQSLQDELSVLDHGIHTATQAFSKSGAVRAGVAAVLNAGPADLVGLTDPGKVEFVPDDGSLAALLRALQPSLELDTAVVLPLRSHGSTLQSIFSAAEAVAAGRSKAGQLVIIGDDFGEGLDAASAEHMATILHREANQTILTTRRSEVVRAYAPEDLMRLTVSHGRRMQHRLSPTTSKSERVSRRLVLEQVMSALTARTLVLMEGPLDVEGYGAFASRLAMRSDNRRHSLSANGIRLIAPPGTDGGISRLPLIARFALNLGFHVRAVVDNDKPGHEDPAVDELGSIVEQLVVLPTRTAVEAALIRGIPGASLRKSVDTLIPLGMPTLPSEVADNRVADYLISQKILKKQGLHVAWVHGLEEPAPIARAVVEAICGDTLGRIDIGDVSR